jgi:hypothetical protein
MPAEHMNLKIYMKTSLKLKINPIREYLGLNAYLKKPSAGLFILTKSRETIPLTVSPEDINSDAPFDRDLCPFLKQLSNLVLDVSLLSNLKNFPGSCFCLQRSCVWSGNEFTEDAHCSNI